MPRFPKIRDNVSEILLKYPCCRENDMLLYRYYTYYILGYELPDLELLPVNYDSISRCRRKLQSESSDYRPLDENVILGRTSAEQKFRKEFKDKPHKKASSF